MAENVFIDKSELFRAASMAETRTTPDGKPYIFTDKGVRGLRLYVQSSKASWIVRWDNTSKTLGYHYPANHIKSITVAQARELAQASLRFLQAGKKAEVDGLIKAFHEQRRGKKSVSNAVDDLVPEIKTWTLRECFENTIRDKTTPGAKNTIGKEMEKDIRITMNRECFQSTLDKPAALVSNGDIEAVRNAVFKELQTKGKSGISPSNKVIVHTRAVLDHCASFHGSASGIDPMKPWWRMLATLFANPKRTRRPELENVVRTLILAEQFLTQPLPGRAIKTPGVNAGTLAGLWWLVLTCQRATAGLTLLPYNIGEDLERPGRGWLLAGWDGEKQKGRASFVLPVPNRAWSFVDSFRQQNRNRKSTDWLFPSDRVPGKHATPSGIYRIIYRLAARDEVEQVKPDVAPDHPDHKKRERKKPVRTEKRDLLQEHDIDFWSPHDLRRTLTSFMIENKIPGAASAILAHEVEEENSLSATATAQARANFQEQQMKRITRMAYAGGESGAQFIELKSKAMKLWTDAVIDCYEELTGKKAATDQKKKQKALLHFLILDPQFAVGRRAEAEAYFEASIEDYLSEIADCQSKIDELKRLDGDQASSIERQEREIEGCKISIAAFERDKEKLILNHAIKQRALTNGVTAIIPDVDVGDYNTVWEDFIAGKVDHPALIAAAELAKQRIR